MSQLSENKPIYIQIKEKIEDMIINGELISDEQIPSTNQMVDFYKVNHLTISKGINLLVEEDIIYKKRGIGMFVAQGARATLIKKRKQMFQEQYVVPLVKEAMKLGLSKEDIKDMMGEVEESDSNDHA